jgi:2-keto-4-pentenoate hydratase/2-oxohepta-3-ene-1,7-dioic acid hydratase in catechol pathway
MYHLLNTRGPDGAARAGLAVNGTVYDLAKMIGPVTTIGLVADWATQGPRLEALAAAVAEGRHVDAAAGSVAEADLLAPLLYPLSLICAGANYAKHVLEMTGSAFDKSSRRPYFFLKLPRQGVIGPGAAIPLPHTSKQVDWEVELAVVIGRSGRNIKAADALDHVAGYTIMNDVSARDLGRRPDWPNWGMDWLGHKSFDGSAPMGPWMVPARLVPDPHALDIRLWVNDELQQDSNTSDLIFDIAEQIEYLSEHFTLHAGDVISTGTPSGVGRPRGLFLKPGDSVRMEIEGIGEMTNPVIAGD